MATTKRRKPKALRKEAIVNIRMTDEQKTTLTEAAQKAGLGVSPWLLSLGLREARRDGTG
jgi:uncharacterized protein (DUF1778 family)